MGFIAALLKRVLRLILYVVIFSATIILIPNLPPYTKFSSIELEPTQSKVGPLAPNELLNNVDKLYAGKLYGPEAFQIFNGELYTSVGTGEIVKISPGGHISFVTKIGLPCTGLTQEHICGRPLGFIIDGKYLYVADAYYGIWKVDLKTDKKQLLVSPRVEIEGRFPKIFNHVALDKNSNLYWTDSSSDFLLRDGVYTMLADPSGRLLQYSFAKNESKVILDNLWFANGLAVSPDNQFVLVAETLHYRIMKYYISGPKKGTSEVFIAGLPGAPDNLRPLPDGSGVLVALYVSFDDEHLLLTKSIAETPIVRKLLARLLKLIEIPFEYLHNLYPHVVLEEIMHSIGHFKSLAALSPGITGLLQVDWDGNIIASYYNNDRTIGHISDAIVYKDRLYTGTPNSQDFIGSVPVPPLLKQAFASPKKSETVKETPSKKEEQKLGSRKELKVENKPEVKKEAPQVGKPASSTDTVRAAQEKKEKPIVNTKPVENKVTPKQPPKEPKKQSEQTPSPASKPSVNTQQTKSKTTVKSEPNDSKLKESEKSQNNKKSNTPKPEAKTATKENIQPRKEETKPTTPKPEKQNEKTPRVQVTQNKQPEKKNKPNQDSKPLPEQIPIKEDISSDTIKPNKDTLKVIKKGGPAEIPNPNQ